MLDLWLEMLSRKSLFQATHERPTPDQVESNPLHQAIMTHEPVKSSMIKSIGYDPESKKMEVKFSSGSIYTHENVEQDEFECLRDAESVGKHYNEFWKGHS
jgi:hypothetical protein